MVNRNQYAANLVRQDQFVTSRINVAGFAFVVISIRMLLMIRACHAAPVGDLMSISQDVTKYRPKLSIGCHRGHSFHSCFLLSVSASQSSRHVFSSGKFIV